MCWLKGCTNPPQSHSQPTPPLTWTLRGVCDARGEPSDGRVLFANVFTCDGNPAAPALPDRIHIQCLQVPCTTRQAGVQEVIPHTLGCRGGVGVGGWVVDGGGHRHASTSFIHSSIHPSMHGRQAHPPLHSTWSLGPCRCFASGPEEAAPAWRRRALWPALRCACRG